jgi:steroid delta-isomerase-like uncharacterized protein
LPVGGACRCSEEGGEEFVEQLRRCRFLVDQVFQPEAVEQDHEPGRQLGRGHRQREAQSCCYHRRSRAAFPDLRHDNVRLHHSEDAVIAEFDLLGTHLGELFGVPATGRAFRAPMVAFFFFDGPEGRLITCERIYFDSASITAQLGILSGGDR